MKKYLIITMSCVVLILTACTDQLDRNPIDSLIASTAYQTTSDLERGLNGAVGNYNFNPIIGFNSIFTDNCKLGNDSGGQELNTLNQILNADTGDRGLWGSRYGVINDINRVLLASENITPNPIDLEEVDTYNNVLAQLYAFRALAHYEVLLYYGLNNRDASSLGVPYIDYVSPDATPARNTTGDVLAAIQLDLDAALSLFPDGTNDISFATPDFVTFLRARIALETGNYPAAITYANDLIDSYPLANTAQYFNMFNEDADVTEVVFRYNNVQGFDYGINFIWNFTGQGPFIEVSDELAGLLDESDIRRTVVLDATSDDDAMIYPVGKYPPNADTNAINDFKAMRISEIYLIRAEAYARQSQFGQAAQDVLSVRNARFGSDQGPLGYGSVLEAVQDVIAERRLELAFEGHRYTDIKRVRDITGEGINREPSDCEGSVPCTLPDDSEKFIFPIPTSELNANQIIAAQQAPGY
ncbi:RagB/SusD family nutrient uptake outer membrane protein [Psychroserpens luteus]|uniref:RagB/SusD family nutrient uptake outer membrane protein n=1 Tax=Psychroserpens luteus TaxID=1434066 RepID=A0ABW5ZRD7_9FLAO|nr:RagB/SusD family nutrient uptake outer membrane protein [Psychroserpens luteus]